jgi:folylpolyglutamate synthase
MATYFRFLTLMAFDIFIKEKVDIAIIEVGLGGRLDATNIIKSPVITGITSLGYEHQEILGDTIEEIAFEKAGIMKKNVPCIIQPQTYKETYKVLQDHSKNVGCDLFISPKDISSFGDFNLGISGKHQELNASLALCLCNFLLDKKIPTNSGSDNSIQEFPSFKVNEKILNVLKNSKFIGRSQVLQYENGIQFLIDGAHTIESLELCAQWFFDEKIPKIGEPKQPTETFKQFQDLDVSMFPNSNVKNILVFNYTPPREPAKLLESVLKIGKFDLIVFCPLESAKTSLFNSSKPSDAEIGKLKKLTNALNSLNFKVPESVESPSLNHFLSWAFSQKNLNILVTGSFYLVGDFNRKFE